MRCPLRGRKLFQRREPVFPLLGRSLLLPGGGMGSSDDGAVYAGEAFPGCVVQPEQRQSWNAQKKTARFLPKEEIKCMFCACCGMRPAAGNPGSGNGERDSCGSRNGVLSPHG